MKRKIFATVLALIALLIIVYAAPRLYRDNLIRRNGVTYSTEVLGISGSVPWLYLRVEAPPGMRCGRRTCDPSTSEGIYCLRAARSWNHSNQQRAQWTGRYWESTIDVIYYDGTLLYAGSFENARLTAYIVLSLGLMAAAVWIFLRGGKKIIEQENASIDASTN